MRMEIHVRGRIDEDWGDWFEGLDVCSTEQGTTILRGHVADPSAVNGLLAKLRDLGLGSISVRQGDSLGLGKT